MHILRVQKGFSLIEVIVSLTIFTAGLLAVATMQLTSVSGNLSARTAVESVAIGQDVAETFQGLSFDHPDLAVGDHGPVTEGRYSYSWNVVEDSIMPGTKTIDLTVQYNQGAVSKRTRITLLKPNVL